MSRIDELIQELCPGGVEYSPLGEHGEFIRGNGLQKKDFVDTGLPAIHYGQVHTRFGISTTRAISNVPAELWKKLRHANPGDLIIATTSEDDLAVAKATAWLGDSEVAIGGDSYIYRHDLEPKYVSYFFASNLFAIQKKLKISGAKVRRISGSDLAKIRVPVPPLEIQQEIVRVLDQFTQLEAELEAELEARKKQYAYYRNQLILEAVDTQIVRLGDIALIGTGSHDTKDAVADGQYNFYARGREPLQLDSYDFDEQAIITAGDGVGVGKVFHFAEGKYALHQRAYRVVPTSKISPRFLYHYLVADFSRYLERTSVHASVTSLRRPMFLNYELRLPSLDEQQRVAEILDRFDALTNDLSSGLPAEIEARRKQYEYYRDKLLSFPEKQG